MLQCARREGKLQHYHSIKLKQRVLELMICGT